MSSSKVKIIRTSTIALSLDVLLKGQLSFLNNFYEIKALSGNDENLQNVKNREGVDIIPLEMHREISIFHDIISLYKMYKILKKEKPTIIHSITPKAGLISMIAGKLAGVPIRMHTFTGLIFPNKKGLLKFILIQTDRLLCLCATHIYPEGEGVKKDLIKYKITNKPLKVIGNGNVNGVDLEYFNPKLYSENDKLKLEQTLEIKPNDFVYTFIGRLVTDKGIRELIDAFNDLYDEHNNVKLLLVGTYDKSDNIFKAFNEKIKKNPGIIHVGWQDDIRPYLSITDCFVLPSYREGFPNVVLQAGAMNLPIIVTDINGSNEIIEHNENGFVIPVKDTISLRYTMKELLTDKTFYNKFSSNIRKSIAAKFEQKFTWDELNKVYQENLRKLKIKKLVRITTVPISMDKLLEGQLGYMNQFYNVTAISSDENGYLQKIADRENVNFYPIAFTRKITLIQDLVSLLKLYLFFIKTKPDIVHTHTPKAGTVGMWAAKLAGVPLRLHTVAGLPLMEATGLKRKLLNLIEKLTYYSAHYVLPNSFKLGEYIIEEKFTNKRKLKVIANGSSNGINVDVFNPNIFSREDKALLRKELNIKEDDFVYIFVGRIVSDKGINELIKAFIELNSPNTKLLLVGHLEHHLDCINVEVLNEIESNQSIINTGWQVDVRKYFAISDVLAFPSYREGFPNVVLQAGAMELPSIVSDINGCNEIVQNGLNGLIVPAKDYKSLKKAMQMLYENKSLYSMLKSNARDFVVKKYAHINIWKELHDFYEKKYKEKSTSTL